MQATTVLARTLLGVLVASCGLAQGLATSSPPAKATRPRTGSQERVTRAQPAVLILRTIDVPGPRGPVRRVEAVQPRFTGRLPFAVRFPGRDDADDDGGPDETTPETAPQIGPGYDCVRAYVPNPRQPQIHYFVYNVDLNNPDAARLWLDFEQARRANDRQARAEWTSDRDWERRKQQLLSANAEAVREGTDQLRSGEYRTAIMTLTRAADLNQGDPTSRILLTLARVAVGHDADAAKALRRALELEPRLVTTRLGLAGYFPSDAEYDQAVDALAMRTRHKSAPTADDYFLLGFLQFQGGQFDDAYAAFRKAAQKRPKDELTATYLNLTKPTHP